MIDKAFGDGLVGSSTCGEWFIVKFKDEFELKDKPYTGRWQEFGNDDLQVVLRDDPTPSMLKFVVDSVGKGLFKNWKR